MWRCKRYVGTLGTKRTLKRMHLARMTQNAIRRVLSMVAQRRPLLCRFSDAGMAVSTACGEAGVGEAPRHEIGWRRMIDRDGDDASAAHYLLAAIA